VHQAKIEVDHEPSEVDHALVDELGHDEPFEPDPILEALDLDRSEVQQKPQIHHYRLKQHFRAEDHLEVELFVDKITHGHIVRNVFPLFDPC
jgi:hypothetical protein